MMILFSCRDTEGLDITGGGGELAFVRGVEDGN